MHHAHFFQLPTPVNSGALHRRTPRNSNAMNKPSVTKKGPSGSPKKQWTTEANEELLVLIAQMYVKSINYDEVAAKLGGVTAIAVKMQWLKLKKRGTEEKETVTGKKGVKRMLTFDSELEEKKIKIEQKFEEH
jgi:hypothetical protein